MTNRASGVGRSLSLNTIISDSSKTTFHGKDTDLDSFINLEASKIRVKFRPVFYCEINRAGRFANHLLSK